MFFVVLALIVSATTYTKAQQTSAHSSFLLSRSPSLPVYKAKVKALLIDRDKTGWHPQAEKHYLEYFAKTFPGKTPEQIVNGTKWDKLPSGTYLSSVGRISKTTGTLSLWGRYSRGDEYKGSYQGIPWTLSDCGNLYPGEHDMLATVDDEPNDYVDPVRPVQQRQVVETIVQQQPQIVQAPAPQIIYVQAQAPAQVPCPQPQQVVYTPPQQQVQYVQQPVMQQPQIQYVQQPMMQQQSQTQYANSGPQEIVIREKKHFLDWVDTGTRVFNSVAVGVNTWRGVKFMNQSVNQINVPPTQRFYDNTWQNPSQQPNLPEIYRPTNPGRGFNVSTSNGLTGTGGTGTTYDNGWGQ